MPITSVDKDATALTMTITAVYDADAKHVWELWADPRKLERWWGPPTHPATFIEHELAPGGEMLYKMTGPDGEEYFGRWKIIDVEAPHRIEVQDVFANPDGSANHDLPSTRFDVRFSSTESGGTEMVLLSTFPSLESMEQLIEMGAEEGMKLAMGQIDGLLADG